MLLIGAGREGIICWKGKRKKGQGDRRNREQGTGNRQQGLGAPSRVGPGLPAPHPHNTILPPSRRLVAPAYSCFFFLFSFFFFFLSWCFPLPAVVVGMRGSKKRKERGQQHESLQGFRQLSQGVSLQRRLFREIRRQLSGRPGADQGLQRVCRGLQHHRPVRPVHRRAAAHPPGLPGPPDARLSLPEPVQPAGAHADLSEARGPEPHRRAQAEPLHGRGPAGQVHGQEEADRRDRRGPARRGAGHRGGLLRHGVRHLHGRGGHRQAGAERHPHEAAGRERGARQLRPQDPQGGRGRRVHGLRQGVQGRGLLHRHRRRPASLPADGARLPVLHRRGGPGAVQGHDGPSAGSGGGLRGRRLQFHRHVHAVPGRPGGAGGRGAPGPRPEAGRPRGVHHLRQGGRHARLQQHHAGRRERRPRAGVLQRQRPGLSRRGPRARAAARHEPRALHHHRRRGGHRGAVPALPARGHHPRHRELPRAGLRHQGGPHRADRLHTGQPLRPRRQGPGLRRGKVRLRPGVFEAHGGKAEEGCFNIGEWELGGGIERGGARPPPEGPMAAPRISKKRGPLGGGRRPSPPHPANLFIPPPPY